MERKAADFLPTHQTGAEAGRKEGKIPTIRKRPIVLREEGKALQHLQRYDLTGWSKDEAKK